MLPGHSLQDAAWGDVSWAAYQTGLSSALRHLTGRHLDPVAEALKEGRECSGISKNETSNLIFFILYLFLFI